MYTWSMVVLIKVLFKWMMWVSLNIYTTLKIWGGRINISFVLISPFFFFWVEHHLFRYNNTKVRIIVVMLSHILSYCSKIIEIMIGLAFRRQMRRTWLGWLYWSSKLRWLGVAGPLTYHHVMWHNLKRIDCSETPVLYE